MTCNAVFLCTKKLLCSAPLQYYICPDWRIVKCSSCLLVSQSPMMSHVVIFISSSSKYRPSSCRVCIFTAEIDKSIFLIACNNPVILVTLSLYCSILSIDWRFTSHQTFGAFSYRMSLVWPFSPHSRDGWWSWLGYLEYLYNV